MENKVTQKTFLTLDIFDTKVINYRGHLCVYDLKAVCTVLLGSAILGGLAHAG